MATFTLPYPTLRWRDMRQNDDPTPYEFLEEIVKKDKPTMEKVCFQLLQPYIGDGSPSIDHFELISVDIDKNFLSGSLDVEFIVDIYFGCDGLDNQKEGEETIYFRLDQTKKTITFTIPELEKRSTFDEF